MKFSSVFIAFGLIAAAAAASTTSAAIPIETSSYTKEQQSCLKGCADDLSCQAECFGNPAPTEDMVNATTQCAMKCVQGDGTEAETAAYAACQQKCIKDNFYSNGSGVAASKDDGNTASSSSGSGSSSSPSSGSGSGTDSGDDASPTATGGAGSDSSTPSSGSDDPDSTTDADSATASTGAAGKLVASGAGLVAMMVAGFVL